MHEYEMIHEILNLCPMNHDRDQFLEEIECDDLDTFVRSRFHSEADLKYEKTIHPDGSIVYEVFASGMHHRFTFSEF
ncbi:MAG: hypothetical protein IJW67_07055 [Blautia sp.]|nr:hypothetical protein [Blautia sp.]